MGCQFSPPAKMKLTVEVIRSSPDFINACKWRELDLRDNKIPFIENLGATKDFYTAIDLSNNEIRSFENFPILPRLEYLSITNNKIEKIEKNVIFRLPALKYLSMANNYIRALCDISNLFERFNLDSPSFSLSNCHLQHLSLMGNDVCKVQFYREWVIFGFPRLKTLDFVHVSKKERDYVNSLFLIAKDSDSEGMEYSSLFYQIASGENIKGIRRSLETDAAANENVNEAKKQKIKEAICKANSLEEVQELERQLLLCNS